MNPYIDENGEHQVGNCSLQYMISLLSKGWEVIRMYYRGFYDPYGNPCWSHKHDEIPTIWYYWEPGMEMSMKINPAEHFPFAGAGWNTIFFRRKKK